MTETLDDALMRSPETPLATPPPTRTLHGEVPALPPFSAMPSANATTGPAAVTGAIPIEAFTTRFVPLPPPTLGVAAMPSAAAVTGAIGGAGGPSSSGSSGGFTTTVEAENSLLRQQLADSQAYNEKITKRLSDQVAHVNQQAQKQIEYVGRSVFLNLRPFTRSSTR